MIEFIKILFLAKSVLLTPSLVAVDNHFSLNLDDPISAISTGASLQINNISNTIEGVGIKGLGINESRKVLNNYFQPGTVKADLISEKENLVINLDNISFGLLDGDAVLILSSTVGIPVGVEFNKIDIKTSMPLKDVTITWKNFSK